MALCNNNKLWMCQEYGKMKDNNNKNNNNDIDNNNNDKSCRMISNTLDLITITKLI
jgi:hypothetical protein